MIKDDSQITVGALLYITMLGSVTTIVANLSAERTKRSAQLESVLAYLRRRMVSKVVFKKVREYYEFMWEDPGAVSNEPQEQLDQLPKSLQIQLASEMHKHLLSRIPVFSSLEPAAAFELVESWQREIYIPNDGAEQCSEVCGICTQKLCHQFNRHYYFADTFVASDCEEFVGEQQA